MFNGWGGQRRCLRWGRVNEGGSYGVCNESALSHFHLLHVWRFCWYFPQGVKEHKHIQRTCDMCMNDVIEMVETQCEQYFHIIILAIQMCSLHALVLMVLQVHWWTHKSLIISMHLVLLIFHALIDIKSHCSVCINMIRDFVEWDWENNLWSVSQLNKSEMRQNENALNFHHFELRYESVIVCCRLFANFRSMNFSTTKKSL